MLFDFLIFLKLSYYNKFLPNIHLEVKDHHQEVQHAAHQSLHHPIYIYVLKYHWSYFNMTKSGTHKRSLTPHSFQIDYMLLSICSHTFTLRQQ